VLTQAEATILRLKAGDILFVKFPEEAMQDTHVVAQALEAVGHAVEAAGHQGDVGVVLTADAIELTVIRPEKPEAVVERIDKPRAAE
jgi:hypothetical protein